MDKKQEIESVRAVLNEEAKSREERKKEYKQKEEKHAQPKERSRPCSAVSSSATDVMHRQYVGIDIQRNCISVIIFKVFL